MKPTTLTVGANDHCNQNPLNVSVFCWFVRSGHQCLLMMRRYFMLLLHAYSTLLVLITVVVSTCHTTCMIKYCIDVLVAPLAIFMGISHIFFINCLKSPLNQGL